MKILSACNQNSQLEQCARIGALWLRISMMNFTSHLISFTRSHSYTHRRRSRTRDASISSGVQCWKNMYGTSAIPLVLAAWHARVVLPTRSNSILSAECKALYGGYDGRLVSTFIVWRSELHFPTATSFSCEQVWCSASVLKGGWILHRQHVDWNSGCKCISFLLCASFVFFFLCIVLV